MFQINVVEKTKIHILCSVTFSENRAVCEIMSKNVVEPERPQMAIWRGVACWVRKATRAQAHARTTPPYTHPSIHPHPLPTHTNIKICNTCFSTTVVSRTRLSVMSYVYCLSFSCYSYPREKSEDKRVRNPSLLNLSWGSTDESKAVRARGRDG
jgi:hypothetical protein